MNKHAVFVGVPLPRRISQSQFADHRGEEILPEKISRSLQPVVIMYYPVVIVCVVTFAPK